MNSKIFLLLIFLLLVSACTETDNIKLKENYEEYAKGELIVYFVEETTKTDAIEILSKYNTTIKTWTPRSFTGVTIKVNEGD